MVHVSSPPMPSSFAPTGDLVMDELLYITEPDPFLGETTRSKRFLSLAEYLTENHARLDVKHFMFLAKHEDVTARTMVAKHSNTPTEVLDYLVEGEKIGHVLSAVARHVNASPESLRTLIRIGSRIRDYTTVCFAAAQNPALGEENIRELVDFHLTFDMNPNFPNAYHTLKVSEYNIFANPTLPVDLIERTIASEFQNFYLPLIGNKSLSPEHLKELAKVNQRKRMSAYELFLIVSRLARTPEYEGLPFEWIAAGFGLDAEGKKYV